MSIKLNLEGFDEMLQDIEAAGGSIDKACHSAISQSAQTMQAELKREMQSTDLSPSLANRMPQFEIEISPTKYTAKVGFKGTSYNPNDPSDYFKVIFANYGTPNRSKHGKENALGFIQRAKKKANRKIKKQQKETLEKILSRLSK